MHEGNNNMILYRILEHDLKLPDYILDEVNYYNNNSFSDKNEESYKKFNYTGYVDRILTQNGKQYPSTKSDRTPLNNQSQQWIKTNICKEFTECSYSATFPTSQSHGPHTDVTRLWLLMYIFDSGGENVKNYFWKQKGQDLLRPENKPAIVCDYSDLELIETVQFPVRTWIVFNTKVIHSVENIERARISIQVGLNDLNHLQQPFLDQIGKI